MRESIGGVYLYNFIIIYIVVVFAFIAAFISYNRAFKVNSRIAHAIEKYEGYNGHVGSGFGTGSIGEINGVLKTIGYSKGTPHCPDKEGQSNINTTDFDYCIYEFPVKKQYYRYGIQTYIYFDVPVVGRRLRIPIYSRSNRIYVFSDQKTGR